MYFGWCEIISIRMCVCEAKRTRDDNLCVIINETLRKSQVTMKRIFYNELEVS